MPGIYRPSPEKEKCSFFVQKFYYLGHTISAEGLAPSPSKIQAIMEVSQSGNVTQLRVFLELISYYAKSLPDPSSKAGTLMSIIAKGQTMGVV